MMGKGISEGIRIKLEMPSPEKIYSPCKSNGSIMVHNWSEDDHDNCLELADSLTIEELRRRSKSKRRKILKFIPMESNANDVLLCCESKRGSHVNAEAKELTCDFNEPLAILRHKLSRKSSRLKISKSEELPIPDIIVDVVPVNQIESSPSCTSQHFTRFPADSINDNEDGTGNLGGPESVVNAKLELDDSLEENVGIISGEDSPRKSLEENSENMEGIEVAAASTKYTNYSCNSSDFELSDIHNLKSCLSEESKDLGNYRSLSDQVLPDYNFVYTDFPCVVNTESVLSCIYESAGIESLDQHNEVCDISDSSNNSTYLQSSPLIHESYDAATTELAFVEMSKSLSSEHSSQLVGGSPDKGGNDHLAVNDFSSPSSSPGTNGSTDAALDCQEYCVSDDSTMLERSTCRISEKTNHETSSVPLYDNVCMENEEIIVCNLQMEDDCFQHNLSADRTEWNITLDITPECSFVSQGSDVSGQSLLTTDVGFDHCIGGEVLADVIPASISGFDTPRHDKIHADPKTASICSSMLIHCTIAEGSVGTKEFEDRSNRSNIDGECTTDLHPTRVDASCSPTVSCAIIANRHMEKDTAKYHEQTPKKLLSNRKVLSPTSQEKLCQAVDAENLFESMQFSDCKKRLRYEKFGNSLLSLSEVNELERGPSIIVKKAKCDCYSPSTKGIPKSSSKMESSLISSGSEDAIKFSQRQMLDIESITGKLVSGIKSMKGIMAEALTSEAFQSTDLEHINKMKVATENASYLEAIAEKYLSMMTRDFKRFCKIMRMKGNKFHKQINDSQKKQRKITFADEAGKSLCHVKVFERLDRDVEVPETCGNDR